MTRHRPPAWLKTAVFYQIYPQSFYDANGDGIGDITGIIEKLDYLQSLGVTALWLNPVFASPFRDAGYDISNFYQVAPRYGTNGDLARLFKLAHQRHMKVCLDLVAGHTSDQHPWFKASAQPEPNRYTNWYIWTDSAWDSTEPNVVRGFSERDGGYLPNYFYFQPSLNYGYANPDPGKKWQLPVTHPAVRAVRQELKNIMRFWLDMGADGFRVDMANSLVRGDANGRGLRALWLDYRSWLDRHYPEAVLISEWGDPRHSIASGFDIDFFLHFGEPAYQHLLGPANGDSKSRDKKRIFFNRRGTGNIRLFLDNYLPHYHATKRRGYIALPTGNHDFSRHSRWQEPEDLRIIYAMLFTMPGVPFILYGDEIGQKFLEGLGSKEGSYSRAGTRAPMQWEKARNFGFSTAAKNKLYLPVNPITDAHNVAAQERNPESLLNLTKRLLILRRQHPALGNCGNLTPVCAKAGKYPFVYERSYRQTRFWVAINPTEFTLRLKLPPLKSVMNLASEKADLARQKTNSTLTMDPLSFGIFKIG